MENKYDELVGGFIAADLSMLKNKYSNESKLMYEITNLALILTTKINSLKMEAKNLDDIIKNQGSS
jgi:hypothetical protein